MMSLPLHVRVPTEDPDETRYPATGETAYGINSEKSQWTAIPYRKLAYGLAGLIALAIFIGASVGGTVGWRAWRTLAKPHRHLHATAKDGSRIVKPFFGPGQIEQSPLAIKLWYRKGVEPAPPGPDATEDEKMDYRYRNMWHIDHQAQGKHGFYREGSGQNNTWQEIWSSSLPQAKIRSTRQKTLKVRLPGAIVRDLANNPYSSIVATFALAPHTPDAAFDYKHASTRPLNRYGASRGWPLGYDIGNNDALSSFLAHSSSGTELLFTSWSPGEDDGRGSGHMTSFLRTRTWISMADDYPMYKVDSFNQAMQDLRLFKESCANNTWYSFECMRTFKRDGHLENLLEMQPRSGGESEWRYGPFLTTDMTLNSPKDVVSLESYVNATASEAKDLSFDWQVTYSAVSPAKLELVPSWSYWSDLGYRTQSSIHRDHDRLELLSALIGHSFDPRSRPITRGLISLIAEILRYLTLPLFIAYWATRRTSTGIALPIIILQTACDLTYQIVDTALQIEYSSIFIFVMKIIIFLLLIAKQLHLLLKGSVEFRYDKFEFRHKDFVFGTPFVIPTAIRMREPSSREKTSRDLDRDFKPLFQLILGVVLFALFAFAPTPPAIIAAPRFEDGGREHIWEVMGKTATYWLKLVRSLQSSVWLVSRISQIRLNSIHRTFAGEYGLTSFLILGSLVFSHAIAFLTPILGRPQYMMPFTFWDLLVLLIEGAMAFQAFKLPKVDQKVPDDF